MNLAATLQRASKASPASPAFFVGKRLVADYAYFASSVRGFAAWLAVQGVTAGDRVAVFMQNGPDYLVALYGIWHAGAVAVPVNAKLHGREVAYVLEDSGAKLVLACEKTAHSLREAQVRVPVQIGVPQASEPTDMVPRENGDMAWLFYTSGTTGKPKGVIITHGMLWAMMQSYETDVEAVLPGDATLYAAPMSHGAGLYALMHVAKGARHLFPVSGGFDPVEIFDLAAFFGDVHMFAAPTMVSRMTTAAQASGVQGTGLKTVVYAGGPMYEADILAARAQFGEVFAQIYGQGECPMAITALPRADIADETHPRWRARLNSVGRAQSGISIRIGMEGAPAGTAGEIMVRGAPVMPGYWNNPRASAETLSDGWLKTGDVGVLDADGYLTLRDRSKDLIITGGSNVYPREVEEVLLQHPDITECSVVGRAHADWGEEVVAFVVCAAGRAVSEADLDALCRGQIARFKAPKAYVFVAALPKNSYGKVLKTELRAML